MAYSVKEIYFTLQGEGAQSGRAAVFCRFAGCNLWSGREEDRATAICNFCDTDFLGTDGPGGGRFAGAAELTAAIVAAWRPGTTPGPRPWVVFTGGEPLLQLDQTLVDDLHSHNFEVAIETNGTLQPPAGIDWTCVSPKADAPCILRTGDELKLVFPQLDLSPDQFADWNFRFFYLQPMDGPTLAANTQLAVQYCLAHPQWRLGLQTHKLVGLP